jgi:hypothetical protein
MQRSWVVSLLLAWLSLLPATAHGATTPESVCAGAFSTDGKTFVAGTVKGEVWRVEIAHPSEPQSLGTLGSIVTSVASDEEHGLLAAAANDGPVRVWRHGTDGQWHIAWNLPHPFGELPAVLLRFSADGRSLLASNGVTLGSFDTTDPTKVHWLDIINPYAFAGPAADGTEYLLLWDTEKPRLQRVSPATLQVLETLPLPAAVAADVGNLLGAQGADVLFWNAGGCALWNGIVPPATPHRAWQTVSLATILVGVGVFPASGIVYLVDESGLWQRLDLASGRQLASGQIAGGPWLAAFFSPQTSVMVLINKTTGRIQLQKILEFQN